MTIELQAVESGRAHGPPIVWLGSLGSTAEMWAPQMAAFDGGARNLRVELPGHGRSRSTANATIGRLADGVAAVLDRAEVERAHIVGLSIGGMMAMALAADHPDRVDRVSLLCTSAFLPPRDSWLDRADLVRREGMAAVAPTVVARWLTPAYAEAHPDDVAAHEAMIESCEPAGYAACCEAIADMDLRSDLGRVAAPTLVVAGAHDPATPPEHGEVVAAGISGARLELVPAAHLANWECAHVVNRLLAGHLGVTLDG